MFPTAGMPKFPYLPPGHEPGPQSRRNRRSAPLLWWFVGIVGFGMFVGGVAVMAHIRKQFPWREELTGGSIFAGMGLLCVAVAYWQYRKFKPPRLGRRIPGVSLAVDRDETRRGETLTATIDHAHAADQLEVGLVCVERYDLQVNAQTRAGMIVMRETNEDAAFEHWEPVHTAAGEQVVTLEIPQDAPYSYEGDCVSYAWRVSARQVRRLLTDPRIDHPVWVSP